ncbi:hypothetical protein, partial [Burkholderia cenocepacia]
NPRPKGGGFCIGAPKTLVRQKACGEAPCGTSWVSKALAQIEIVSSRLAKCISPVGMPVRQQLMLLKSRTFCFSFVSA